MGSVISAKRASSIIVIVIPVFSGSLPLCTVNLLRRCTDWVGAVKSYLNCFAGGMFMGTAMLHLQTEAEEEMKETLDKSNSTSTIEYPFTELAISSGIFFFLLIQACVLCINSRHGSGGRHHRQSYQNHDAEQYHLLPGDENSEPNGKQDDNIGQGRTSSSIYEGVRGIIEDDPSVFRSVVIGFALSLHMIFEGLAIAFQETQASVWTLLLAVSLHKCIVFFSVGLRMRQISNSRRKFIGLICFFAVIVSIAITIGIAIMEINSKGSLLVWLLQSVATGTFLYVTFFEILQREFSNGYDFLKLCICLVGYAAVAALKAIDYD